MTRHTGSARDAIGRAEELLAHGEPERAKAVLRQALAGEPGNLVLLDLLGQAYHDLGDVSTAAQCWLRSGRNDARAREAIARLVRGWGRWRSWWSLNCVFRFSEAAVLEQWRRLLRLQTEEGDAFVRSREQASYLRGCGVLAYLVGAIVLTVVLWDRAGPLILVPAAGMPLLGYLQGLYKERRRMKGAVEKYERLHRQREEKLEELLKDGAEF